MVKTKKLRDLGIIVRGVRIKEKDKVTGNEKGEYVKILNWTGVNNINDIEYIDSIQTSIINLDNKKKKTEAYIEKGDIVFPVFPMEKRNNVIYIEDEVRDNCIYSETLFAFKLIDKSIDSKYIYMLLNTDCFYNHLLNISKTDGVVIKYRLTNKMLEELEIPILDEDTISKLINEYNLIKSEKEKLMKKEQDFNDKLNSMLQ